MPERATSVEEHRTPGSRVARTPGPAPQADVHAPGWVSHTGARMPSAPGSAAGVHAMQRLAGNQAVMRMLDRERPGHAMAGPLAPIQALRADELDEEEDVQRAAGDLREPSDDAIRSAAAEGVRTPSTTLPYLDRIQASFGRHSISHVQAHVGPEAAQASHAMNALAYASGNHVVFGTTPDLRTAAHEAAHIVQQQAGVQLSGGIGRAGDPYERHADAVADAVVAGRSAEGLLETRYGNRAVIQLLRSQQGRLIQRVNGDAEDIGTEEQRVHAAVESMQIHWNSLVESDGWKKLEDWRPTFALLYKSQYSDIIQRQDAYTADQVVKYADLIRDLQQTPNRLMSWKARLENIRKGMIQDEKKKRWDALIPTFEKMVEKIWPNDPMTNPLPRLVALYNALPEVNSAAVLKSVSKDSFRWMSSEEMKAGPHVTRDTEATRKQTFSKTLAALESAVIKPDIDMIRLEIQAVLYLGSVGEFQGFAGGASKQDNRPVTLVRVEELDSPVQMLLEFLNRASPADRRAFLRKEKHNVDPWNGEKQKSLDEFQITFKDPKAAILTPTLEPGQQRLVKSSEHRWAYSRDHYKTYQLIINFKSKF